MYFVDFENREKLQQEAIEEIVPENVKDTNIPAWAILRWISSAIAASEAAAEAAAAAAEVSRADVDTRSGVLGLGCSMYTDFVRKGLQSLHDCRSFHAALGLFITSKSPRARPETSVPIVVAPQ